MQRLAPAADRTVLLVFLSIVVFGGSNAVAIRLGAVELPPFWGATLRFAVAAVVLAAIAAVRRSRLPRGRALAGAVVYGILNFGVSYAFIYVGLESGPAGVAQVVVALVPLLTLILAVVHGLERFSARGLVGSLVAATGIAIVFGSQLDAAVPPGALAAFFASAVSIAWAGVMVKRLPPGPPVGANLVGMTVGTAILAALSLLAGERWALPATAQTWASVLYLSTVGSVALFLAFLYVIARWTASATSYVLLLMPLWTVAVASVLLPGEPITLAFAAGGGLVLAGTYFGAFGRRRPSSAEKPEHAAELGEARSPG